MANDENDSEWFVVGTWTIEIERSMRHYFNEVTKWIMGGPNMSIRFGPDYKVKELCNYR